MPSARLTLSEQDVVRLALEFLHTRELHITQLSLERETGVINGDYSGDVLFLRQLILDGQWDDVFEFVQPLEALEPFDARRFHYIILRHKYVELLCIKSETGAGGASVDSAVSDVVKVLNEIERLAPSKDEYSNLCMLLTLPRLTDHLQYKDWNPSNARVQCFREVFPLVEKFLPGDRKSDAANEPPQTAFNDRLVHLIIKGILYESCVNYCQVKATGAKETASQEMSFSRLLDNSSGPCDSDLSLLSWLQSIPAETFSLPFEQRVLNIDIERLERPSLETSWTEHMLVTPIKPKLFPHCAMPFTRPRSAADMMSRSLLPALDGLPSGLRAPSPGAVSSDMSRSTFAGFHLTGYKSSNLMNTSVDRLFGHDPSSSYSEFLPAILEATGGPSHAMSAASTPEHRSRESPASTNRSSRRDSLTDRPATTTVVLTGDADQRGGDMMREFQRQKQRLQESLTSRAAERDELVRQIAADNRLQDNSHKNGTKAPGPSNGTSPISRPSAGGSPMLPSPSPGRGAPASLNSTAAASVNGGDVAGLQEGHYDAVKPAVRADVGDLNGSSISGTNRPKFVAVTSLEDVQAVRCAEFHPLGKLYAVGSNSKTLRICAYPKLSDLREDHTTHQPTVLFKRTKHHKGSIYCMAWTPIGDLMATGSNDKTVKLMRFNTDTSNLEGQEVELTMHDGTIRDLCFLEDTSNKSSLLISAGAGDCKIYVTDCATGTPFQALSGHSGHVLTLYNWGGAMFVSGSQDKTVRFWDLRTRGCVNVVTPATAPNSRGSPVAATSVDPSGRLLVSGHEDSYCVLFDIRGGRNVQCFKPHASDVRSVRFSPSAYYLLTTGYDNKIVLTDLQGDLTLPLPSVVVAQHQDKVISGRWHPSEFSFLSTSADKTATLWALPPV